MSETPTSGQVCAKGLQASCSHHLLRTPHHPKTPMSRRLTASRRAAKDGAQVEEPDYKGLLLKTWKTYTPSPLYKFKLTEAAFTKYARSLDVALSQVCVELTVSTILATNALSQEKSNGVNTDECGSEKSSFSLYEGLHFNDGDAQAIQIQITDNPLSDSRASIVLNAFLICVDLDGSPLSAMPANLRSHFTYYPVILISGSNARTGTLLTWLEQHFDCHTESVRFSDKDLRWMLACWCCQDMSSKSLEVLLKYSLSDLCEGISTIDCKFDVAFCKKLWGSLNGNLSDREIVNEMEVKQFVDSIEQHLEYTMHIVFSKLSLSEVGTSVARATSQGELKLFKSCGVFPALHLICEIVKDRYLHMGQHVI